MVLITELPPEIMAEIFQFCGMADISALYCVKSRFQLGIAKIRCFTMKTATNDPNRVIERNMERLKSLTSLSLFQQTDRPHSGLPFCMMLSRELRYLTVYGFPIEWSSLSWMNGESNSFRTLSTSQVYIPLKFFYPHLCEVTLFNEAMTSGFIKQLPDTVTKLRIPKTNLTWLDLEFLPPQLVEFEAPFISKLRKVYKLPSSLTSLTTNVSLATDYIFSNTSIIYNIIFPELSNLRTFVFNFASFSNDSMQQLPQSLTSMSILPLSEQTVSVALPPRLSHLELHIASHFRGINTILKSCPSTLDELKLIGSVPEDMSFGALPRGLKRFECVPISTIPVDIPQQDMVNLPPGLTYLELPAMRPLPTPVNSTPNGSLPSLASMIQLPTSLTTLSVISAPNNISLKSLVSLHTLSIISEFSDIAERELPLSVKTLEIKVKGAIACPSNMISLPHLTSLTWELEPRFTYMDGSTDKFFFDYSCLPSTLTSLTLSLSQLTEKGLSSLPSSLRRLNADITYNDFNKLCEAISNLPKSLTSLILHKSEEMDPEPILSVLPSGLEEFGLMARICLQDSHLALLPRSLHTLHVTEHAFTLQGVALGAPPQTRFALRQLCLLANSTEPKS
jgi:hypothetical protein